MPSSFSSGEVSVKSLSQDSIFAACADRPRPMRVRKVETSGTKGVGRGTGEGLMVLWRDRCCCWNDLLCCVNCCWRRHGAHM